jgi:hypothetical protein
LRNLRARIALRETRPGIFYAKGRAFLHFHADRTGLFADLREGDGWRRLPVNDPDDCKMLIELVDGALEPATNPGASPRARPRRSDAGPLPPLPRPMSG